MQAVGTILWKVKTDCFGLFRYSSIVPLSILVVLIIGILPALASEAFATEPTAGSKNGRVMAVASAQVIRPFTLNSMVRGATNAQNSAISVSRHTTFRNCEILSGADANRDSEESCELRLIELQ